MDNLQHYTYDAIKTCEDKRFPELQITVKTKKAQRTADGVSPKSRRDLEKSDAENCFLEIF